MNSTFLLAASSEAFNPCWRLFCISAVTWRERLAPVPKHWEQCPRPQLSLAGSQAALEVEAVRWGRILPLQRSSLLRDVPSLWKE